MEWISTRRRLPKFSQTVLICYKPERDTRIISTGFCQRAIWAEGKRKGQYTGKPFWCETYGRIRISVTHWMPFPEFPKSRYYEKPI